MRILYSGREHISSLVVSDGPLGSLYFKPASKKRSERAGWGQCPALSRETPWVHLGLVWHEVGVTPPGTMRVIRLAYRMLPPRYLDRGALIVTFCEEYLKHPTLPCNLVAVNYVPSLRREGHFKEVLEAWAGARPPAGYPWSVGDFTF